MPAPPRSPLELEENAPGPGELLHPPELAAWPAGRRYAGAAVLGILAALLNLVTVPLLGPESPEFLLGGALALLACVAFGAGPGLLATVIGTLPLGTILPEAPALFWAYLVYPLEALLTYALWRRTGSLVMSVSVFWLLVGSLWDGLTYHGVVGLAWSYVVILFIKQLLNGLLNALLAEAALRLPWLAPRTTHSVSLRQFVFSGIVAVVVAPGLLLAILFTRGTYERHVEVAEARSALAA